MVLNRFEMADEKDIQEDAFFEASRNGSFDDEMYEKYIQDSWTCALEAELKARCEGQCSYCAYYFERIDAEK